MSDTRRAKARIFAALGIAALIAGWLTRTDAVIAQQQYDANLFSGLRWRMIGPFRGG